MALTVRVSQYAVVLHGRAVFIIHRDQLQKKLLGDDYVTGQINCRVGYDWVIPVRSTFLLLYIGIISYVM